MKIKIKPLSVNECFQGKRFKTPKYAKYERDLLYLLPHYEVPQGNLHLILNFGLSNMGADIDNPVKPFVDILQKRYKFNDNRITEMTLRKHKVKKGKEYIIFEIKGAI